MARRGRWTPAGGGQFVGAPAQNVASNPSPANWTPAGGGQFTGGTATNVDGGNWNQPSSPRPATPEDTGKPPNWLTDGGGNNNPPPVVVPPPRSVVGTYTKRTFGGKVQIIAKYSNGDEEVIDEWIDKSAGEAVEELFNNLGLGAEFSASLKSIIDNLYETNVAPNKQQILNAVYYSEPYKKRFAANEIIRQRMASNQSRPGDRMLTPAEYIEAEQTYRTILADRDMPIGFYDSPDDFTNLIANSISADEFRSRVDTAYDALNFADENVLGALRDFYGLSNNDLAAYLLDPARAMPIIEGRSRPTTGAYGLNSRTELQRMYGVSNVAGMGRRQGLSPDQDMAGEIFDLGRTKAETEQAFSKAAAQAPDVERLGRLYGESMDFKDIVREDLNLSGGAESGRRRKKFASKERAQFGARSALDATSLRDRTDV